MCCGTYWLLQQKKHQTTRNTTMILNIDMIDDDEPIIESTEERLNALRMQHHGSQRPLFLEDGTIDPTLVRNEARTMASVLSNMPPTIVTNEIVMEGEADTLLDECLRFQPFVSKTLPEPRETGPQEFKYIIMENGLPNIKSCGKKFKNLNKPIRTTTLKHSRCCYVTLEFIVHAFII